MWANIRIYQTLQNDSGNISWYRLIFKTMPLSQAVKAPCIARQCERMEVHKWRFDIFFTLRVLVKWLLPIKFYCSCNFWFFFFFLKLSIRSKTSSTALFFSYTVGGSIQLTLLATSSKTPMSSSSQCSTEFMRKSCLTIQTKVSGVSPRRWSHLYLGLQFDRFKISQRVFMLRACWHSICYLCRYRRLPLHRPQSVLWRLEIRRHLHHMWIYLHHLWPVRWHLSGLGAEQRKHGIIREVNQTKSEPDSIHPHGMPRPLHKTGEVRHRSEALLSELPSKARFGEADVHPKAPSSPLLPHKEIRALPNPKNIKEDRPIREFPLLTRHDSVSLLLHHKKKVRKQDLRLRGGRVGGFQRVVIGIRGVCRGHSHGSAGFRPLRDLPSSEGPVVQVRRRLDHHGERRGGEGFAGLHDVLRAEGAVLQSRSRRELLSFFKVLLRRRR